MYKSTLAWLTNCLDMLQIMVLMRCHERFRTLKTPQVRFTPNDNVIAEMLFFISIFILLVKLRGRVGASGAAVNGNNFFLISLRNST